MKQNKYPIVLSGLLLCMTVPAYINAQQESLVIIPGTGVNWGAFQINKSFEEIVKNASTEFNAWKINDRSAPPYIQNQIIIRHKTGGILLVCGWVQTGVVSGMQGNLMVRVIIVLNPGILVKGYSIHVGSHVKEIERAYTVTGETKITPESKPYRLCLLGKSNRKYSIYQFIKEGILYTVDDETERVISITVIDKSDDISGDAGIVGVGVTIDQMLYLCR